MHSTTRRTEEEYEATCVKCQKVSIVQATIENTYMQPTGDVTINWAICESPYSFRGVKTEVKFSVTCPGCVLQPPPVSDSLSSVLDRLNEVESKLAVLAKTALPIHSPISQ